jgi:purine-nucleoside phosphorylase
LENLSQKIQQSASFLREQLGQNIPRLAIVLGSGLGSLADELSEAIAVPYSTIPNFVVSTVAGHAGRLVAGKLGQTPLIALQGRVHFYEGYDMQELTFGVRVLKALGVETLILTNAAGGLNPAYRPGDLMGIRDHIFFPGMAGFNPLRGANDDTLGPRFPALQNGYDPALLKLAVEVAAEQGLTFHQGTYIMLAGPNYETSAELKYLRLIGGDAVGMSTAPETIVAVHGGMQVLGISTITNTATGEGEAEATHAEVVAVGQAVGPRLASLIKGLIAKL